MVKYEYDIVSLLVIKRQELLEIINTYGSNGWELITVDSGIAFFKRPLPDEILSGCLLREEMEDELLSNEIDHL
jgi:hypothetical protein